MDARVPDKENFIPLFMFINRAANIVLVPLSTETMASSSRCLDTAAATDCGLITPILPVLLMDE
jgi:hypothetical protein